MLFTILSESYVKLYCCIYYSDHMTINNVSFQKMRVNDVRNAKHVEDCSSFSKFVKFLIFIRFVPVEVNLDNSKVSFKLCSSIMFSCISVLW